MHFLAPGAHCAYSLFDRLHLLGLFGTPKLLADYEHQPGLPVPMTTVAAQGIPGDALNIGLVALDTG